MTEPCDPEHRRPADGLRHERTPAEDPFVGHRRLLFTVAYEVLGSAADAEDVVQETWLRWAALAPASRDEVVDPRAYLVRSVTRQALNRLRTLARRREEYVGEWLPEPLLVGPDVAEDVELAESVSYAMLTVLETLGPAERAVFVLREVFATPYEEIAAAVGRTPAAVRQIAHRARAHVSARRPRTRVSRAEQDVVVERFLAAVRGGDLGELMEVLAPDVIVVADGGGVVNASRRPVRGAGRVSTLLATLTRLELDFEVAPMRLNGGPAARFELEGRLDAAVALVIEDGRVSRIYVVRNPHKLGRLDREAELGR
ncbi:RNA polymerase sigma-70 factor [Nonomuraea sp. NPDC050310]|uniref:RNA polymerase sigma-70 factor n=1 Tax=Nonomuraea sp. NPDC050310 TaxID=3154935 RepID=UPI0033E0DB18